MKRAEKYESPEVTVFELVMSDCMIQGSIKSGVETEGQDFEELDYSDGSWS